MAEREGSADMNLEDVHIREFDESSSSRAMKSKMISKKGRRTEYISFFKFHFDKLRFEHPKWSLSQLNKIARLLWQKKKMASLPAPRRLRSMKPVTGRKFFLRLKREMGMVSQDAMRNWKRLPRESRMLYERRGNPAMVGAVPLMMTRTMKLTPNAGPMAPKLDFLNRLM
jgi:hypothetical protein